MTIDLVGRDYQILKIVPSTNLSGQNFVLVSESSSEPLRDEGLNIFDLILGTLILDIELIMAWLKAFEVSPQVLFFFLLFEIGYSGSIIKQSQNY